jgi:MFS family permease
VRTRAFYLLWAVLFLNVTAGIGILEHASPMIQDLFPDGVTAAAAAGFVGLLSLFNMAGRFGWSSLSDRIGRKATYAVYFLLGGALYALLPSAGRADTPVPFVAACAVIMSMYGGGFATIPAYLRDLFGTTHVGAIHGRLLTAWACAGVAGPMLVNHLRDDRLAAGVPAKEAYDGTLYLLAGLLFVGAVCNALIRGGERRPPAPKPDGVSSPTPAPAGADWSAGVALRLALAWAWVGVPLGWGVIRTVDKAAALFR